MGIAKMYLSSTIAGKLELRHNDLMENKELASNNNMSKDDDRFIYS